MPGKLNGLPTSASLQSSSPTYTFWSVPSQATREPPEGNAEIASGKGSVSLCRP
jgi:hypothetical protein